MMRFWDSVKVGYLRVIEPVAEVLTRHRVNPNVITTVGTLCTLCAAAFYASGHISIAGWVLGLTALFDVLDGVVARRTGRETAFGAFYDSTLDRVSDGAILAGLTVFYASSTPMHSLPMVIACLVAIVATFVTSYARARAEGLGFDARVGLIQRPERVVLLSAPQALFGLAFDGWVLKGIVAFLAVTACVTAVQRVAFVRHAMMPRPRPAPVPVAHGSLEPANR